MSANAEIVDHVHPPATRNSGRKPRDGAGDSDADASENADAALSRTLGPVSFALYGAGTILGAGIYVLIGEITGRAGFLTPLAFVVAAFVAGVNGMVYAELGTPVPSAGRRGDAPVVRGGQP